MKLTRLGEFVFFVSVITTVIMAISGLYALVDHINWVGDHWCFHSMISCYKEGK